MHQLNAVITKRIQLLAWYTLFFFCIITMRLFYLQVNLTHYFHTRSTKNFLRSEHTYPLRGNILDCTGKLIATNRPVTNVVWHGTGNNQLTKEQTTLLAQLEHIIEKPITSSQIIQHIRNTERSYQKLTLAYDISFAQLSKLEEQFPNHPNIHIKTQFTRYYPYRTYACHILGYLGNSLSILPTGQMGLEKLFEDTLRGKDGIVRKKINSFGKNLSEKTLENSSHGNNIQTTLDMQLQHICEKVFPDYASGTLILLNPHTGDLVSLVSRPAFDPDIFLKTLPLDEWNQLQIKKPFINRAFNATYPPGSIFKLVTASAALESKLLSIDSTIECKGYVNFGGRNYWCNRRYGHGALSTIHAIGKSCNILFFEIGKIIDIDLLADYAHRFGLGKKTNILFPESSGLIPTRTWKNQTKQEPWWPGETLSVSIGQSFLLVTPIQVATMIGSIFTGYLVRPRILRNEPIIQEPIPITPETRAILQESMRYAVMKGTGKKISQVKDIEVYAKTSTAQMSNLIKRNLGSMFLEHGWFVCYFSYKNHSPLVVVILVEHAGTSQVVTTIAKNLLSEYKKIIDSQEKITQK